MSNGDEIPMAGKGMDMSFLSGSQTGGGGGGGGGLFQTPPQSSAMSNGGGGDSGRPPITQQGDEGNSPFPTISDKPEKKTLGPVKRVDYSLDAIAERRREM
jgi:hypothetical protein